MVDAEIISVGTELLLGEIVDTNSAEISESLAQLGINVFFQSCVGDNPLRMAALFSQALVRSQVVIITGGLGPTEDDRTKEVLARVGGVQLRLDPQALAQVERYFQVTGREMTENNKRQAMMPEGAEILENPRGTAPGVYWQVAGRHVFCLPGVPTEMRTMWRESVVPKIAQIAGVNGAIFSRTLRFFGIGESSLEEKIEDLVKGENPTVAPYAGSGEVRIRITARENTQERARQMIEPVEKELRARLGQFIYGYDDDTLESVVGRLLTEKGMSLATAESCTGGLLGSRLTDIPGSSAYYRGGWIAYSNEAKVQELGVDAEVLAAHGAVSEEVAAQMALGAQARSKADFAVSITGIAGPDGGSAEKPVGLVCFGVAGPEGVQTTTSRFTGAREDVKWRSSNEALNLIRLAVKQV